MKKIILLIFFAVFVIANMQAQQSYIDSLETALKTEQKDTSKVRILLELAKITDDSKQNQKIKYAEMALQLSEKLNKKVSNTKALNILSTIYNNQGNYNKALECLKKAYEISFKIENKIIQKDVQSAVLINFGNSYLYMGKYKQALEYYFKSLRIAEGSGDTLNIASSCNNIGNVYYYMKQYDNAIAFYKKTIEFYKTIKAYKKIIGTSVNIGAIYSETGRADEALKIFKETVSICRTYNDKEREAICLTNIGYIELNKFNFSDALEYFQKALKIDKEINDKNSQSIDYFNIAEIKNNTGCFNEAISIYSKSLDISVNIGNKNMIKENYLKLSDVYSRIKNFEKAYEYYKLYSQFNDSIYNETNSKQIAEMQAKYETAIKDKTINELNKEKEIDKLKFERNKSLMYGLIILIALVIVIFFMIYKISRQKQKSSFQAILNEKQRNIALEILEAQENERNRIGKDLHDGLGSLIAVSKINFSKYQKMLPEDFKDTYKSSLNDFDNISNEVRKIAQDLVSNFVMEIGVVRAINEFVEKINNNYSNINVNFNTYGNFDSLSKNIQITIYRISQELIYNCVKHADAREVVLEIFCKDNCLILTVEDNGKGFVYRKTDIIEKGMGLHNIKNRLDLLKGKMQVDSQPDEGSVITLEIPVQAA